MLPCLQPLQVLFDSSSAAAALFGSRMAYAGGIAAGSAAADYQPASITHTTMSSATEHMDLQQHQNLSRQHVQVHQQATRPGAIHEAAPPAARLSAADAESYSDLDAEVAAIISADPGEDTTAAAWRSSSAAEQQAAYSTQQGARSDSIEHQHDSEPSLHPTGGATAAVGAALLLRNHGGAPFFSYYFSEPMYPSHRPGPNGEASVQMRPSSMLEAARSP